MGCSSHLFVRDFGPSGRFEHLPRQSLKKVSLTKKFTKKQRQIWEYMRLCPDETNYSTIAKGAKVTRHTVAKHFEMIQKMLGIQETAPHPLLDCQTVPLMV